MGENQLGQLGDGSVNSTNKPEVIVAVPVGTALTAAAGGYDHSLFIRPGGVLWATGDNAYGQLGDLATIGWYTTIPKMIVSSNVTAVAAGWWYSLFAKSDDSLWAMGWNLYGQLGDGTTNSSAVPKLILASNVVAVAAGDFHSLFVKSDGSLWGMGYNGRGQLGDGTTNESHIPKLIVSSGVVAVSAGRGHSLFLKSDGSLWGIGENDSGQLGLGDFTDRHVPTLIYPRPPTITSISVSGTNVVVSWPANNFPFYLQSATNLVPPVAWTIVLSPTNIIGDQVFVTNPIAGPQQFYRLSD
jgi:alpha-tubulin suppressor-like RCC1 family protein